MPHQPVATALRQGEKRNPEDTACTQDAPGNVPIVTMLARWISPDGYHRTRPHGSSVARVDDGTGEPDLAGVERSGQLGDGVAFDGVVVVDEDAEIRISWSPSGVSRPSEVQAKSDLNDANHETRHGPRIGGSLRIVVHDDHFIPNA